MRAVRSAGVIFAALASMPAPAGARLAIDARPASSVARSASTTLSTPTLVRGRALRREQTFHGLPVLGRGRVDVAPGLAAVHVVDLEPELPSDAQPALNRAEAVIRAQPFTRVALTSADAHLVVHAGPRGARLAWLITPPTASLPAPTAPRVAIDAVTGRVLEARDRVRHANAYVYRDNPVRTPTPELLPLPDGVSATGLTSSTFVARSCVDRGGTRVIAIAGASQTIRVCALEQVAVPGVDGDFVFTPRAAPIVARDQADPFAETSLFWHASRLHAFFERLSDGAGGAPFGDPPLELVAGLKLADGVEEGNFATAARPDLDLVPFPGAFFLPGVGEGDVFRALYGTTRSAVWFGHGANVDFSYDGDVVAHEVTHALVASTLAVGGYRWTPEGVTAEPEAIDEAIADYFTAALTNDPSIGDHAATESPSAAAAVRTLSGDATCADTMVGEPHRDSLVLSRALWKTRTGLAEALREPFDAAVYRALFLSPGRRDLGFEEVAALVRARVASDVPEASALLDAALAAGGIGSRCIAIRNIMADVPVRAEQHPFVAPGTDDVGADTIAPGVMQLRFDVPSGAHALAVSFRAQSPSPSRLFGRPGTTFRPVVLASWEDRPITWTRTGDAEATPDASTRVAADGGARVVAELRVPPSARVVHLQIANEGQLAGLYDDVIVSVVAPSELEPDGGSASDAGADDAGADVLTPEPSSSCACDVVGLRPERPAFAVAFAFALLAARRARRRR